MIDKKYTITDLGCFPCLAMSSDGITILGGSLSQAAADISEDQPYHPIWLDIFRYGWIFSVATNVDVAQLADRVICHI